jgi:hypothetical protein
VGLQGSRQGGWNEAQNYPEPGEDAPEVVAGGGGDGVCGIAGLALEVAAAEMAFFLHVTDEGLDGRAPTQLSFDGAEDAAVLAGDEDVARMGRVVPAIPLST